MIGVPPGAVKEESKKVISTGQWEDVGRIRAQTWNLAGLRVWQLSILVCTMLAWAYAWFQYRQPAAVIMSNDMTEALSWIVAAISIGVCSLICYDVYTHSEADGGIVLAILSVALIVLAFVIWQLIPVIVWSLINCIAWGIAPAQQIVFSGFFPMIFTVLSLSIIPDFQIGRLAFWRELVHQPEGSSEKTVLDVTQVRLKEMEIEHDEDKWERTNNSSLIVEQQKDQIEALLSEINMLRSQPANIRIVAANHGTARATFGSVEFSGVRTKGKISDRQALVKFLTEFDVRGTARDVWTGPESDQRADLCISQEQWEKIVKALKNVNILDANNVALVTSEDALNILKSAID